MLRVKFKRNALSKRQWKFHSQVTSCATVLEEDDGSPVDDCPGKSASDAGELQARQIYLICSLPLCSVTVVCIHERGIIGSTQSK